GAQAVFFLNERREGKEKGQRNFVVKTSKRHVEDGVMRAAIERWQGEPLGEEQDMDLIRGMKQETLEIPSVVSELEAEQKAGREYLKTLGEYFPKEHILRTYIRVRNVPVAKEAARLILKAHKMDALSPSVDIEVPAVVRVQQKIPEHVKSQMTHGSFGFRYAERFQMDSADYERLSDMAFDPAQEFDPDFASEFFHQGTRDLLKESKNDSELKEVLVDLVSRAIRTTNEKQIMLDLAGNGNVVIAKNPDGKWGYTIIDPDSGLDYEVGKRATNHMVEDGVKMNSLESGGSEILNSLNYARYINLMARTLEIEERIQYFDAHYVAEGKEQKKKKREVLADAYYYMKPFAGPTVLLNEEHQTLFMEDLPNNPEATDELPEQEKGMVTKDQLTGQLSNDTARTLDIPPAHIIDAGGEELPEDADTQELTPLKPMPIVDDNHTIEF
ncbi:MAG: hypothetical protein P8J32_02120, partial [bacterium]|nr:hypothetical protein [bacterium]